MCGRSVRVTHVKELAALFDCAKPPDLLPRYNIAPTQPVLVVRIIRAAADATGRELALVRWSLIP